MRYRIKTKCPRCACVNEFDIRIETAKEQPTAKRQKIVSGWDDCFKCGKGYKFKVKIGLYNRVESSEYDEPLPRRKGLGFWNH